MLKIGASDAVNALQLRWRNMKLQVKGFAVTLSNSNKLQKGKKFKMSESMSTHLEFAHCVLRCKGTIIKRAAALSQKNQVGKCAN